MLPPPSCPGPPAGGGLRPARKAFVLHQFSLVPEYLPPCVGADLCVRPDMPLRGTRSRADTQVGPYGVDRNTHQPQKSGRGQSPAPTGRSQCQTAGRCTEGRASADQISCRNLGRQSWASAPTKGKKGCRNRPGQRRRAERLRRGCKGWVGIAAEITPQYPATSDNPSVAAFGRQLLLRCPKFFAR